MFLIAAALTTVSTPVDAPSGARAEARATATIRHAVSVQNGRATTAEATTLARPLPPRRCDADGARPDCRLIVFDLP